MLRDASVVKCGVCGFYYTDPMPFWGEEELQLLYSNNYFPTMTAWWERTRTETNPRRRFDIVKQCSSGSISRFLEVGCGLGYAMAQAMQRGWSVYGQDVSLDFASQVKERLGIEIFVGQLKDAKYPSAYFDAVYLDSVLEHVPNPRQMLQEIRRILRPGGVVNLVVPNEDALANDFRGIVYRLTRQGQRASRLSPFQQPYHMVGFNKRTLQEIARRSGLQVKHLSLCSGANYWRKWPMTSVGAFLTIFKWVPVYLIGQILRRGITLEAVLCLDPLTSSDT